MHRAICCLLAAVAARGLRARERAPPERTGSARAGERRRPRATRRRRRRSSSNDLVEAYFEKILELNPLFATFIDDHRYDDRLANDISPEGVAERYALEQEYLDKVQTLDPTTLSGQDRLTYDIFVRDRRSARSRAHLSRASCCPSTSSSACRTSSPSSASGTSVQPFATYEDYRALPRPRARLRRLDGPGDREHAQRRRARRRAAARRHREDAAAARGADRPTTGRRASSIVRSRRCPRASPRSSARA